MNKYCMIFFAMAFSCHATVAMEKFKGYYPVAWTGDGLVAAGTLPKEAYSHMAPEGVMDFQVFSDGGEALPFAVYAPKLSAPETTMTEIPLWVVDGPDKAQASRLKAKTVVSVREGAWEWRLVDAPSQAVAASAAHLVFRYAPARWDALRLVLADTVGKGQGFIAKVSLWFGDDLLDWTPWKESQCVAFWNGAGAFAVDQRILSLPANSSKYIRMDIEMIQGFLPDRFRLQGLVVKQVKRPLFDSLDLVAVGQDSSGAWLYKAPGPLPVYKATVLLDKPNTWSALALEGRKGTVGFPLGQGDVYWLQQGGFSLRQSAWNGEDAFRFANYRLVPLAQGAAALGGASPRLRLYWRADSLAFATGGAKSAKVAVGIAARRWERPSVLLGELPGKPVPLAWADFQLAAGEEAFASENPVGRIWLWASLGLALLVLGLVSAKMWKELGSSKSKGSGNL